jgi:tetratricopeptide (TPR) repeat protein
MKMKNSNKKNNYDSRLKSSTSLSLRFCFYIFCFTFLSFRLATSLTGVVYANSAADNGRKLSQGSVLTSIDPNNVNVLELLRADLSVAYSKNDTKSKDQLRSIIEQIRSVEFEPQRQTPEPVVVPEKPPAVEPNKTALDVPEQKEQVERAEQAKQAVEPKQQHGLISEKTSQVLRALAKNPGKISNPFELGEILFVSGNLKEAAIFYSEALKRKDPNDAGESQDRAWILFQIGNCLCNDDKPAAAKMYQQLLREYPNSPWAALATARNNLIAWYLKDEPLKLIQQVNHAGSEQDNGGQDKHE